MRSRLHGVQEDVDAAKGRRGVMKYVGEIEVPLGSPRARPHARLARVAVASADVDVTPPQETMPKGLSVAKLVGIIATGITVM